jgi:hypothetical protein
VLKSAVASEFLMFQAEFVILSCTTTVVDNINHVPVQIQILSISPKSKVILLSGEIVIVLIVLDLTLLETTDHVRNLIPDGKSCVTVNSSNPNSGTVTKIS